MLRTRKWVALTCLALLIMAGFGLLSHWQWERAQRDLITNEPTVPVQDLVTGTAPLAQSSYGQRVSASGVFDSSHQVVVRRDSSTFVVVTPLMRVGAPAIAVGRGTVSSPTDPAIGRIPAGQVTIEGTLQPFDGDPGGVSNLPAGQANHLTAAAVGLQPLVKGWIAQAPAQDGLSETAVAYGPSASTGLRAQNVTYAIQWILFAGFVVFFWWRLLRDDLNDQPAKLDRESMGENAAANDAAAGSSQVAPKVRDSATDSTRKKVY